MRSAMPSAMRRELSMSSESPPSSATSTRCGPGLSKTCVNVTALLLPAGPADATWKTPETPGNDITLTIGRDHLAVDLGDVKNIFPEDQSRISAVVNGPTLGFGIKRFFLAAAPLVHYENDLSFNDALRGAIDGEEFRPNTAYEMRDQGQSQAD